MQNFILSLVLSNQFDLKKNCLKVNQVIVSLFSDQLFTFYSFIYDTYSD